MPALQIPNIIQGEEGLNSQMFVSGWFTAKCLNGDEPNYGYPKNHLPETTISEMRVETGFLSSRKAK